MKKLFFFIAALCVSIAVNAGSSKQVSPGQGNFGTALSGAKDGDTLLLAAGTYVDIPDAGYLIFDNKSVIVKAAEDAEVILQPKVQVRLKGAARAEFLGVKIDDEKNKLRGEEVVISTPDSKVKVAVIPTNEELAIARDTLDIVSKL